LLDLVNGQVVDPPPSWIGVPNVVDSWIEAQCLDAQRFEKQSARISYWIERRDEIWINRASQRATDCFLGAVEAGQTHEAAIKLARETMKIELQKYSLDLENFNIAPA
jgi:hypothetical protein